jgi:hypothetical protein
MDDSPHLCLHDRVVALGKELFTAARSYVVIVRGGSEGAGLLTIKAIATAGPIYWIGLGVLLLSLLATAFIGLRGHTLPTVVAELWEGEQVLVPTAAVWIAPLVMAFGWSYLLMGGASYGLTAYVILAAYGSYYGLFPGLLRANTLWFAALPIWLLVQGAWLASTQRTRWRLPLLALLSLLIGMISYRGVLGRPIIPGQSFLNQSILGAIYFALVANPWALRPRAFRPKLAFAITLILFLGFYVLAILQSPPEEFPSMTFLALHHLLGAVGLFWYWMGLDLFNTALSVVEWVTVTTERWVPLGLLHGFLLIAWVIWAAFAFLASHVPPMWLLQGIHAIPLAGPGLLLSYRYWAPSVVLAAVTQYHLYVTLGILALAVALWLARKLSHERLIDLLSYWLLSLFILWGGWSMFYAFAEGLEAAPPSSWTLLLFVGGMFWEVFKNSSSLVEGDPKHLSLFSGFVLCLAGVSLFELSAGYGDFEQELSINAFNGVLYLGLPYMAYTFLYHQHSYTPVNKQHLLGLFLLGLLSALPILAGLPLFLAPALWLAILLAAVWRWGHWDDRLDGVVYAVAVALGFVTYYTRPIILPVPMYIGLVGKLMQLQAEFGNRVIWPWETRWWWITAGSALAAALLGYLCGLAHRRHGLWRIVWLFLGACVSIGLLAAVQAALF